MAKTEADEAATVFLSKHSQYDRHPDLAIPHYLHRHRYKLSLNGSCCLIVLSLIAVLSVLSGAGYALWPSKPEVKIVDIQLNHVNVSKAGGESTLLLLPEISMDLRIQVRNRDFFVRDYNTIIMMIQYEGKWQGNTTADGVSVDARSTSFLELNAKFNLSQAVLRGVLAGNGDAGAKEAISLGVAIHIGGNFQFLFFNVPVNGSTSCAISIDADNQALTCQECCSKSQEL